tara:strand:- start:509 stop:1471 length:963 start_codon:yes stop_codon:yes gene_type:complete
MKILITGSAGFIGFHLAKYLLNKGHNIVGVDAINSYYDTKLKQDRNKILLQNKNYKFLQIDLSDMNIDLSQSNFDVVIHLAAQAGVRYSIENPKAYVDSNILGFYNILEICKNCEVKHLVYASSSSVYGNNSTAPFAEDQNVDEPESFYAASKKSNELMAHAFSKINGLPMTGLRFFTVYGAYGRPDMAYYKFTKKIFSGKPIEIYNNGKLKRDFTHIDDIVFGIDELLKKSPSISGAENLHNVFNIGNNSPTNLMEFISVLENAIGREANKIFMPMQKGDVYETFASIEKIQKYTDFRPRKNLQDGLVEFVDWYKSYYD